MNNQNRDLEIAFRNDHSVSNRFVLPEEFETSVRFAREIQSKALKTISKGPHGLINAAMAFGKSTVACIHSAKYLTNNPKGRVLLVVPEDVIANSFRLTCEIDGQECNTNLVLEEELVSFGDDASQEDIDNYMKTAKQLEWVVGNDIVGKSFKKIDELKRFLKNKKSGSPSNRVCLVTRQTLVLAFDGMTEKSKKDLLKDTLVVIDEAHTVSVSESHKFGTMYQWLRKNSDELSINTLLLTATFFRGDKMRIMTDEQYESLCVFQLSFKEHFNSLSYLEEISIRFAFYDYSLGPVDMIESIIKDKTITKPIVYLPPRSGGEGHFPPSEKPKEVREIMKAIAKGHGHKGAFRPRRITGTSVFKIKINGSKDITIADLTDETYIKATKKYLDRIKVDPNALDSIISLNRAQQGFDWVSCDGTITLGKRSSMTVIVQITGRSCRDAKGKTSAVALFAIPTTRAGVNADRDAIKNSVTDCTNAIIACMQLHDIFEPVTIYTKLPGMKKREKVQMQDVLSILFEDEKTRKEFEGAIEKSYQEGERYVSLKPKEKKDIITQIMIDMGIPEEDIDAYMNPVFLLFEKRRNRMIDVISKTVEGVPILEEIRSLFNHTVEDERRGTMLAYLANHIGVDRMDDMDNAISKIRIKRLSDKDFVEAMREFITKNNRRPSNDSKDHWEKRLAKEFINQLKKHRLKEVVRV